MKLTGKTHDLKAWPPFFEATARGDKQFETRIDDRGYQIGDRLRLHETNPVTGERTGRWLLALVTWVTRGEVAGGLTLPPGVVVLGTKLLERAVLPVEGAANGPQFWRQTNESPARWVLHRDQSHVTVRLIDEAAERCAVVRSAPPPGPVRCEPPPGLTWAERVEAVERGDVVPAPEVIDPEPRVSGSAKCDCPKDGRECPGDYGDQGCPCDCHFVYVRFPKEGTCPETGEKL